jgi:hypothetical protein
LSDLQTGGSIFVVRAIRAPEVASAFSRTIRVVASRVMPFVEKGDRAMASNNAPVDRPSEADAADFYADFGLSEHWGERVITAVAAALAITIVGAVALLMGMS